MSAPSRLIMKTNDRLNCHLSWNKDFASVTRSSFRGAMEKSEFVDVTLMCEGLKQVQAHKIVLSACSDFFRSIFLNTTSESKLLIYLDNISFPDLENVISFMYSGETQICLEEFDRFMMVAKRLKVKGLSDKDAKETEEVCEEADEEMEEACDDILEGSEDVSKEVKSETEEVCDEVLEETEEVCEVVNEETGEVYDEVQPEYRDEVPEQYEEICGAALAQYNSETEMTLAFRQMGYKPHVILVPTSENKPVLSSSPVTSEEFKEAIVKARLSEIKDLKTYKLPPLTMAIEDLFIFKNRDAFRKHTRAVFGLVHPEMTTLGKGDCDVWKTSVNVSDLHPLVRSILVDNNYSFPTISAENIYKWDWMYKAISFSQGPKGHTDAKRAFPYSAFLKVLLNIMYIFAKTPFVNPPRCAP